MLFNNFDFSCLDDPEYKEDSVREDIVAPLLKYSGYKPNGKAKLVRSRALTHPYVLFGSQKRKVNIVPDYLLEYEEVPVLVLDAKKPNTPIINGDNVAQAYSYAIHPEVRAQCYGLCNGKQLTLFEIQSIEPKCVYDLTKLDEATLLDICQKIHPRILSNTSTLDMNLDGGTYLHMAMDIPIDQNLFFDSVMIPSLAVLNDDQFTINVTCTDMASRPLAMAFDLDRKCFEKLLEQFPVKLRELAIRSLRQQPFTFYIDDNPPTANILCRQTVKPVFSRSGEMFFPFEVLDFPLSNPTA